MSETPVNQTKRRAETAALELRRVADAFDKWAKLAGTSPLVDRELDDGIEQTMKEKLEVVLALLGGPDDSGPQRGSSMSDLLAAVEEAKRIAGNLDEGIF